MTEVTQIPRGLDACPGSSAGHAARLRACTRIGRVAAAKQPSARPALEDPPAPVSPYPPQRRVQVLWLQLSSRGWGRSSVGGVWCVRRSLRGLVPWPRRVSPWLAWAVPSSFPVLGCQSEDSCPVISHSQNSC